MRETVLLLHGIWMRPVFLQRLAGRLHKAGYRVVTPVYASVRRSPAGNAERLFRQLSDPDTDSLHIVAHSLGGIVALHLLTQHQNELPPGRLVTLGSPVNGSCIARTVQPWPLLGKAFGNSLPQGLSGDGVPFAIGREWGAIIGTRGLGLGIPFLRNKGVHDGAVLVDEALHPAQTAHLLLPVSHTEMLFSSTVFQPIECFLRTGVFRCG